MGRDRISELPDFMLTQILLNLPTKDSVRTSVLSTRWRNLWLNVPGLDLSVNDLSPYWLNVPRFIDKFIEFNHISRMQKLMIKYNACNDYRDRRFLEWIGTSVDRGIQHLDVETDICPDMPQNIYKSNTLVSLKLVSVGIEAAESVVSLPCLKIMHLEDIAYDDDPLIMEKLISGCPVLEDLTVIRNNVYVYLHLLLFLRVRSQTLISFRLAIEKSLGRSNIVFSVEMDAPRLEFLSFKDNQSDMIVIKNLSSLDMIDIDTEFNAKYGNTLEAEEITKRDIICDFLSGICSVRHMIIFSNFTFLRVHYYKETIKLKIRFEFRMKCNLE